MALNGTKSSTIKNDRSLESDLFGQQLSALTQQFDSQAMAMLRFQQDMMRVVTEVWKSTVLAQTNVVFDLFQIVVEQNLSVRERLGVISEYQLKRLQEIVTFEQGLTLDAAEIFQAQTGATHEQFAGVWHPASKFPPK